MAARNPILAGEPDIPLLIGRVMERHGWDTTQLAEEVGVHYTTPGKWLRRISHPDRNNWAAIAKVAGIQESDVGTAIGRTPLEKNPSKKEMARRIKALEAENAELRKRLP